MKFQYFHYSALARGTKKTSAKRCSRFHTIGKSSQVFFFVRKKFTLKGCQKSMIGKFIMLDVIIGSDITQQKTFGIAK